MLIHELLSSLDIHLLSAGRTRSGRDWHHRNVNSFYSRMFLVTAGEAKVIHHGREYQMGAGDMHLAPCYCSTDYICDDWFDSYYITFTSRAFGGIDICSIQEYEYQRKARELDWKFMEELLQLNPGRELPTVNPFTTLYRKYHEEQSRSYHERPPAIHLENMSYITLLLTPFLSTGMNLESKGTSTRLFAFLRYVEENLHRPITIKDIADELRMAPNYLSDWLAKEFRIRPVEYINLRRIEEAQLRLITSRKSVKEVAFELGFSSVSYFSRVFKAHTGTTASRYRSLYS